MRVFQFLKNPAYIVFAKNAYGAVITNETLEVPDGCSLTSKGPFPRGFVLDNSSPPSVFSAFRKYDLYGLAVFKPVIFA